ncbi:hypothetical protein GQ600_14268 [Phytophthora cactorum]|nr:hypothetical protein GQ600_14268 [Phytophthora cactorum]
MNFVDGITSAPRSVRLEWSCNTVSSVVGLRVDLITDHAWEWVAGSCGILVWTVTEPLRSMVIRLFSSVGYLVYKWAKLLRLCITRYWSYVRGPAVQD